MFKSFGDADQIFELLYTLCQQFMDS